MRIIANSNGGLDYVQEIEPNDLREGRTWFKPTVSVSGTNINVRNGETWVNSFLSSSNPASVVGYGYIVGGGSISLIDRILFPFASGTSTNVGYLSSIVAYAATCNSSTMAYVSNGDVYNSKIQRFMFPFNSGTASLVGNTAATRLYSFGFNSSITGYVAGSGTNYGNYLSSIDGIDYPFDSGTSSIAGYMVGNRWRGAAVNSSIYGYYGGGTDNTSEFSNIQRLAFPFSGGTMTATGTFYYNTTYHIHMCISNSSIHGFFNGTAQGDSDTKIERLTFPFDSGTTSHVGNSVNYRFGGGCNSTSHGFLIGNYSSISVIERIAFPFNSGTATAVGYMSSNRSRESAIDNVDFVQQFI